MFGDSFQTRKHRGLILPDVLGSEPIGWTAKVASEVFDCTKVSADGQRSVVAALQLLKHDFLRAKVRFTDRACRRG